MSYGPDGQVARTVDAAGDVTTFTDSIANGTETNTQADSASGFTTSITTDAIGRVLSQTDAANRTTSVQYQADGSVVVTDPRGKKTVATSTPNSITTTDPLGHTTTDRTSDDGLTDTVTYATGTTTKTTYQYIDADSDIADTPTSLTDPEGHVRQITYDDDGTITSATDLAGAKTTYTAGSTANSTVATGPTGLKTTTTTDDAGNVTQVVYPDGGTEATRYDDDGNPLADDRPSGTTIQYGYDAAGNLASRTTSTGESTAYSTSDDGLDAMTDTTGTTKYTHDPATGNLQRIDLPGGAAIAYQYNPDGQVTRVTAQAGTGQPAYVTSYHYDPAGNLDQVTDPAGHQTTFTYDDANRLVHRVLPDGVTSDYTYDALDQVATIVHRQANGQVIASVAYQRGLDGEPLRITREDGSFTTYTYDPGLQLASEVDHDATGTIKASTTYTYDAAGNRAGETTSAGASQYHYDGGGNLLSITGPAGTQQYTTDLDGRTTLINRGGSALTVGYNTSDQVTRVQSPSGTVASYTYNGQGDRVAEADATGTHQYLAAPLPGVELDSPYLVTNGSGALLAGFVYAGDHPLFRYGADGSTTDYLEDGMGSIIGQAGSTGTAQFRYDGFGNLVGSTGTAPSTLGGDFRFQGQWLDAGTGLYNFRAREYDPQTGRFLSRDPIAPDPQAPETFNNEALGNSNPLINSDPTGMETASDVTVSTSVSQSFQGLKSVAINAARNEIKQRLTEFATQSIVNTFTGFITGSPNFTAALVGITRAKDFFDFGNNFHRQFEQAFQNAAPEGIENLYFEPTVAPKRTIGAGQVYKTGDAILDGLNSASDKAAIGTDRGPNYFNDQLRGIFNNKAPKLPRPDFIINDYRPTSNKQGYLVGDLKLGVSSAYRSWVQNSKANKPPTQYNQFLAIAGYARNHGYRLAALITVFQRAGGDRSLGYDFYRKAIVAKFATQGVAIAILTVVPSDLPFASSGTPGPSS